MFGEICRLGAGPRSGMKLKIVLCVERWLGTVDLRELPFKGEEDRWVYTSDAVRVRNNSSNGGYRRILLVAEMRAA